MKRTDAVIVLSFAAVLGVVLSVVDAPAVSQTAQTAAADIGVDRQQGGSTGLAAAWVAVEIGVLAVVVGGVLLYRRLRSRWQWWARRVALGLALGVGMVWAVGVADPDSGLAAAAVAGGVPAAWLGVRALDRFGVWWLPYNLLGLALAVWGAVALGYLFSPVLFAALAVVWLVYDHVAADRAAAMQTAAGTLLRWRLPVIVIVPDRWRYSTSDLAAALHGDGGRFDGTGLGVGDYALAGAFAAGIAIAGQATLATVTAGFGVGGLAAGLAVREGGGAGLPWIFGAMLPVWTVGVVV